MEFPAQLLDELARVYARAALDRMLREFIEAERREREASGSTDQAGESSASTENPSCEKAVP